MANSDAPFGFKPNINLAGGTPARLSSYVIAPGNTNAIFSGDLVLSAAAGGRQVDIVVTGTSSQVLGVFAGCQFVNDQGDVVWLQYWPGNALADLTKVVTCYVYDDPMLELTAQITTLAAIANIGDVFDIVAAPVGSVVTGRSAQEIDAGEVTNPKVRVTGLSQGIDGIQVSEVGAFAKVRCVILEHEKAPNPAGLGAL